MQLNLGWSFGFLLTSEIDWILGTDDGQLGVGYQVIALLPHFWVPRFLTGKILQCLSNRISRRVLHGDYILSSSAENRPFRSLRGFERNGDFLPVDYGNERFWVYEFGSGSFH